MSQAFFSHETVECVRIHENINFPAVAEINKSVTECELRLQWMGNGCEKNEVD
jgi:hypothetical protein